MPEYFIHATSFAAPFCSDEITRYVSGETPAAALDAFVATKPHPCGIYAAEAYDSADSMHKGLQPAARYMSNRAIAIREATAGKCGYTMRGEGASAFEVDGQRFTVENPREGHVIRQ